MARTIAIIKKQIAEAFMANAIIQTIYEFADDAVFENEFSNVSFEKILFDVVAYAIWLLESIFDQHKKEIDAAIYEQKSGTPRWYRNMSLAFQYGFDLLTGGNQFDLLTDSDKFDNTHEVDGQRVNYTAAEIEASKIIKYCSVKESSETSNLTIKVAGESANGLEPLKGEQLESFTEYLAEIKYAGVKLNVVNNPADQLVLVMQIYRNVLVLDSSGNSIKLGGKPVETAIKTYMKNLPFDGELVLNDLIEKLRALDGVNNVNIINASSNHWDSVSEKYTNFMSINVKQIPESGYFEVGSLNNSGVFEAGNFNSVSYVV